MRRNRITVACARCARPFEVTPSRLAEGKGKYCGLVCYRATIAAPAREAACERCGAPFRVEAWRDRRANPRFCSVRCSNVGRRKDVARVCKNCGGEFRVRPSAVAKGKGLYCSLACRRQGDGPLTLVCAYCGATFPRSQSQVRLRSYRNAYCSKRCLSLAYRSVAPEVRGSPDYRQWRIAVFMRDKHTCQMCGARRDLNAHHIKSFHGYPALRLDVENGVTLCHRCHFEAHGERWQD